MLLDESRICSRLEHANVAQILDVGEHGQVPYIVFEWVEGASLEQVCRAAEVLGDPVALGPLLRVMADVCSGLHAAHELRDETGETLGVVHRDVTPNNIIVSRKGFAKLIDFGVAKARGRMAGETRSGIVKGTPQYMAPEQARGDKVDRRADVFAVGAVLYRALAGKPPFKDRFALESFVRKLSELPPLPESVPADVREIVRQAMHRDPAARFVSADEMRFALERVRNEVDSRRGVADLFPREPPRGSRPDIAEMPTAADSIAFARTSTAALTTSKPPPSPSGVSGVSGVSETKPSERPIALPTPMSPVHVPARGARGASRGLKVALAVAVTVAACAMTALIWLLLRS
jgi:serine/threonine-protein kinase